MICKPHSNAAPSLLRLETIWSVSLLVSILLGCNEEGGISISIPERFVIASTPIVTNAAPETRVSINGIRWSGPNFPRDANGNPMAAKFSVPAGICANANVYLLAWFDPNNILHTQTSNNGLNWSTDQTHGTHNVDIGSRPALAYNYTDSEWLAAFRLADETVAVRRLDPAGTTTTNIGSINSTFPVAFAWTGGQYVLAFRQVTGIWIRTSIDGVTWTAAVPAAETGTQIGSEGAPFLTNSLGTLYMCVNPLHPLRNTNSVGSGFVEIYSSLDGIDWTFERLLDPTNPFGRGAAIAGPMSAQVMMEAAAGHSSSDAWLNNRQGVTIQTRTSYEVSLAFGPNGANGAGTPGGDIANVRVTFNRFKRCRPVFQDYEDVTLEARHLDLNGNVIREMPVYEFEDAYKHEEHFWNEGGRGDLPKIETLMQPGEIIEVRVTGDEGTAQYDMTFDEIANGIQQFFAEGISNACGYFMYVYTSATLP
jgi:hypothetical protein